MNIDTEMVVRAWEGGMVQHIHRRNISIKLNKKYFGKNYPPSVYFQPVCIYANDQYYTRHCEANINITNKIWCKLTRCWTIPCLCERSFLTTVKTSARDSVFSCGTKQLKATYTELRSEPDLKKFEKF